MESIFLVVEDLTGQIDDAIVHLINSRHTSEWALNLGATWQDLKTMKESNPIKGAGYPMFKGGVEFWVLPFRSHENMYKPDNAEVLTREQKHNYGWDIIEENEY